MLFYLDKDLAKQGIAKCIAVSEKMINGIELEERKKYFQVKEVLIFEGNDIPHKFKFNESLNTIEEFIEVIEDPSQTLSEDVIEHESDFDESVEIDSEKQYFYIDKEYADRFFKSKIIAVFEQSLKKPAEYFQKEVYQHYGKDIPYYITVEDSVVREATEYEKYKRSQRKLEENEVAIDSKKTIVSLAEGQYVEADEVVTVPCPEEYLKREWDKVTHTWKDLTTDLDRVEAQYSEYEGMDTPSTIQEMKLQDEALATEYLNMMIELRGLIYTLSASENQPVGYAAIHIPKPSETLQKFKEKFNLIK